MMQRIGQRQPNIVATVNPGRERNARRNSWTLRQHERAQNEYPELLQPAGLEFSLLSTGGSAIEWRPLRCHSAMLATPAHRGHKTLKQMNHLSLRLRPDASALGGPRGVEGMVVGRRERGIRVCHSGNSDL